MVRDYVSWGAGPRASQYLVLAAKARAVLHGRYYVSGDDIRAVATPVLRHRIVTNFNAEAEGIKADDIVAHLAETIPVAEDTTPRESNCGLRISDCGLIASHRNPQSNAPATISPLLDPQTLAQLQGLELRARRIVEGYVAGLHRSPYHGFSNEFAEHREYAPGDDLRYVDWKVFGKTDKVLPQAVRRGDQPHLLLAARHQREHAVPEARRAAVEARLRPVRRRRAGLLVLHQRDGVGPGDVRPGNPPAHPAQQQPHAAQAAAARDGANRRRRAKPAPGRSSTTWPSGSRRRGIVVVLSDLFDDVESMLAGLKHFRHRRHDVIVLHVLDPAEIDFPFQHVTMFKGLEALGDVVTEPRSLRAAYQHEVQTFVKQVRTGCRAQQIDYLTVRTDQPLDIVLTAFLSARKKRVK